LEKGEVEEEEGRVSSGRYGKGQTEFGSYGEHEQESVIVASG
jgi:hypothetical protein